MHANSSTAFRVRRQLLLPPSNTASPTPLNAEARPLRPPPPAPSPSPQPADSSPHLPSSSTATATPQLPLQANLRLEHLLATAAAAPHSAGLSQHDPNRLRDVLSNFLHVAAAGANKNTVAGERSALKLYWEPYCDWLGIDPVRSNMAAHSGSDPDLYAVG